MGEQRLTSACIIEDWLITADMKPAEIKSYLRRTGLKFNYRSSKGYYESSKGQEVVLPPAALLPPQLAMANNHGPLKLRKPKNEADIARFTTFFTFILPSDVRIDFVDEALLHIGIFRFLM